MGSVSILGVATWLYVGGLFRVCALENVEEIGMSLATYLRITGLSPVAGAWSEYWMLTYVKSMFVLGNCTSNRLPTGSTNV
jgi:hypothetical protein